MPTICENKEFEVALRPVKTELVKVCWRMGWHLGTSGGPLPLLLKITSNARSSVLFVSVCKVTISDYYEPLTFNGITGEKIYR